MLRARLDLEISSKNVGVSDTVIDWDSCYDG